MNQTLTAKELREWLSRIPGDAPVTIATGDNGLDDTIDIVSVIGGDPPRVIIAPGVPYKDPRPDGDTLSYLTASRGQNIPGIYSELRGAILPWSALEYVGYHVETSGPPEDQKYKYEIFAQMRNRGTFRDEIPLVEGEPVSTWEKADRGGRDAVRKMYGLPPAKEPNP